MSLLHGEPLLIEDLDVTMKCITFTEPTRCTQQYLDRIMKNLRERSIPYVVTYVPRPPGFWFFSTDTVLTVGIREFLFSIN